MSLIWPQLYQHRPGRKLNDSISSREQAISEESRFLCHRYLSRKMRRLSLTIGSANLAQVKSFKRRTDEHTTLIICQLIETMEQLYPDIYNNIATNLHISTFTERILCQDFGRFTEVLFKNGMKWSLVLAYFAFCGGLAEECVRHGNARLINSILNWNESFVSSHLGKWIVAEGGWPGLVEYFRKASLQPDINATPGRVARVAGTTMTSLKAKTRSLMKTYTLDITIHFGSYEMVKVDKELENSQKCR
eukprot:gene11004-19843_t